MKRHDKLAETIPYGSLGILTLESSRGMGEKVNDYIVGWRAKELNATLLHQLCRI